MYSTLKIPGGRSAYFAFCLQLLSDMVVIIESNTALPAYIMRRVQKYMRMAFKL